MDDQTKYEKWPVLTKSDRELNQELRATLSARVVGDPYSSDGEYAACLDTLPVGLRAMAATHWLDISLTLDSITWHFGNFGERRLVAQTEAGLIELGLLELAGCFHEAANLMLPLLEDMGEQDLSPSEMIEERGLVTAADELNERAWAIDRTDGRESVIYEAWLRYTREHPEAVFGTF